MKVKKIRAQKNCILKEVNRDLITLIKRDIQNPS